MQHAASIGAERERGSEGRLTPLSPRFTLHRGRSPEAGASRGSRGSDALTRWGLFSHHRTDSQESIFHFVFRDYVTFLFLWSLQDEGHVQ